MLTTLPSLSRISRPRFSGHQVSPDLGTVCAKSAATVVSGQLLISGADDSSYSAGAVHPAGENKRAGNNVARALEGVRCAVDPGAGDEHAFDQQYAPWPVNGLAEVPARRRHTEVQHAGAAFEKAFERGGEVQVG